MRCAKRMTQGVTPHAASSATSRVQSPTAINRRLPFRGGGNIRGLSAPASRGRRVYAASEAPFFVDLPALIRGPGRIAPGPFEVFERRFRRLEVALGQLHL